MLPAMDWDSGWSRPVAHTARTTYGSARPSVSSEDQEKSEEYC